MLKTEVMNALLYACATGSLDLRTSHQKLLLQFIDIQHRQRTDRFKSRAKTLEQTQYDSSVETTFPRGRLLYADAGQRATNERLTRRVKLGR